MSGIDMLTKEMLGKISVCILELVYQVLFILKYLKYLPVTLPYPLPQDLCVCRIKMFCGLIQLTADICQDHRLGMRAIRCCYRVGKRAEIAGLIPLPNRITQALCEIPCLFIVRRQGIGSKAHHHKTIRRNTKVITLVVSHVFRLSCRVHQENAPIVLGS